MKTLIKELNKSQNKVFEKKKIQVLENIANLFQSQVKSFYSYPKVDLGYT